VKKQIEIESKKQVELAAETLARILIQQAVIKNKQASEQIEK